MVGCPGVAARRRARTRRPGSRSDSAAPEDLWPLSRASGGAGPRIGRKTATTPRRSTRARPCTDVLRLRPRALPHNKVRLLFNPITHIVVMKSECFKSHWCQAYKWVRDTKTSKVRKRLLDSTKMSKVKELVAPAGSHFQSFETSICTAAAHVVTATCMPYHTTLVLYRSNRFAICTMN